MLYRTVWQTVMMEADTLSVFVKAPAKINLSLDVLYRRPDGYHEVDMVMTMVDLADRIGLEERDDGKIRVWSNSGVIPLDERNLAWRAASLLRERYGIRRGVTISIYKEIPVSAGLAGGSSDAAAVLKGLNRLWRLGASWEELAALGLELGSDVPFCLLQGTARARGRGERLEPLPPMPACWVVLAKPPMGLSTADVYGQLDVARIEGHPNIPALVAALENGDFQGIVAQMGNVLEPVVFRQYPEVAALKERMVRFARRGVLMSGSGPTVYALLRQEAQARKLSRDLRGVCKEVYMVRLLGERPADSRTA